MKRHALVVSRCPSVLRVLQPVLEEAGFRVTTCQSSYQAMERLAAADCTALVQDMELPGAEFVMRMARMSPDHLRPVIFGVLGDNSYVETALNWGANFLLYKPLETAQVERCLRIGQSFAGDERRRAMRREARSLVHFDVGSLFYPALLQDLSESGMAVQTAAPLPEGVEFHFRVQLPNSRSTIHGAGEIVWTDQRGRAGLFFTRLEGSSPIRLKAWLDRQKTRLKADATAMTFQVAHSVAGD